MYAEEIQSEIGRLSKKITLIEDGDILVANSTAIVANLKATIIRKQQELTDLKRNPFNGLTNRIQSKTTIGIPSERSVDAVLIFEL